MDENVIEKLLRDLDDLAEETDSTHRLAGIELAMGYIRGYTRPEQFMPPLENWPRVAGWCVAVSDSEARFFVDEPEVWIDGCRCRVRGLGLDDNFPINIPLGIDWRTLKINRWQMEEWDEVIQEHACGVCGTTLIETGEGKEEGVFCEECSNMCCHPECIDNRLDDGVEMLCNTCWEADNVSS